MVENIVMITIDCLRADHLHCYGYERNTSPNIDKIAKKALLFKNCMSCGPSTPYAFYSLFTGKYHNGNENIGDEKTLAEILRNNGFKTVGIHSNPVFSVYKGFDKGFDVFEDLGGLSRVTKMNIFIEKNRTLHRLVKKTFVIKMFRKLLSLINIKTQNLGYSRGEILNKRVFSILNDLPENFFLWLHYMDPHYPYNPPKRFEEIFIENGITDGEKIRLNALAHNSPWELTDDELSTLIDLYDSEIRYVDFCIGKLFENFKKHGLLKNSLIIITADHGEEFREYGDIGHYYKFIKELLNVPLIIFGNGRGVVEREVSHIDIFPTIMKLLGIEYKNVEGKYIEEVIWNSQKKYR